MGNAASSRMPGRTFLHAPGPTPVPDEVIQAMSRQPHDLGDPRVPALVAAAEQGLKRLLQTECAQVIFYAANGHGAWEAAIANLVAPGQAMLIPGTGHFSDSWAAQLEALGGRAWRTPYSEGQPIDPAAVEAALCADSRHEIVAVCVVHTDTASGVTSDLRAIRDAIDRAGHPALYVVDVVASLAAAPFAMDALSVDVALGASQKGLMVHPGLAFVAANERALAVARQNPAPRFYWDWQRRLGPHPYQKFCGTLPIAHVAGLVAALELIGREGLPAVLARHARIAGAVQAAVERWGERGALRLFARTPAARSASVTAVESLGGFDPEALRTFARERFSVAMAGGLGPLSGRVFRVGHLGDVNEPMILGALGGIEAALAAMGIAHAPGGVEAAVRALTAVDPGR
jgi:alanine-glyoxylate transaminase/serine-glyoxylate transaminase/serine-pyruvate transaminase